MNKHITNYLIKGKKTGEFIENIDGEEITIILSGEGKFETAWGKYIYKLSDF